MLIHEIAEKTAIAPHTIRFYEKEGLSTTASLSAVTTTTATIEKRRLSESG